MHSLYRHQDAWTYVRGMGGDGYEPDVRDATLLSEIELLAEVIAAATDVEGRFTSPQLDRILGLAGQEPA
jgi:hypothetical protein